MAINFDDQSTGVSYQQYPKDPAAREQIAIVDNKVEELKDKVVSKQEVINLENKVKQSGLDNDNKIAGLKENVDRVEAKVDGLDGGNLEKIEELESAVNLKADKNVVDSLLNQIEGSVKQINGVAPDEEGNVIIDVNTEGLATIEEVTTKTDELAGLVFSKAEKADVETLVTQVASKASAQSVTQLTSQLAETVKDSVLKSLNAKIPFGTNLTPVKGDGINDDAPLLQGIINYLTLNGGGTVFLPKGVYILKSPLYWKSNVSLVGSGVGITILKPYNLSGSTEGFSAIEWVRGSLSDKNPMVNCVFSNFEIDGIDMTISKYTHKTKGFYIQYMRNCIFRDLLIQNTGATGLGIDFLDKVVIDNVNTKNCGRLWSDDGDWGGPGGAGIGIGTGGMLSENFTITNCIADGNGHYGIFVEDQLVFGHLPSYPAKGCVIANCVVKNGRWDGIGVKAGSHIQISDNVVYNNTHNGIAISHGASNVMIAPTNIVTENGNKNVAIYSGSSILTPTIRNNGRAVFKTDTQYVKLPSAVGNFTGFANFAIVSKFMLTSVSNNTIISKFDTGYATTLLSKGWGLRLDATGILKIEAYLTNGGVQIYRKGTTALTPFKDYYVKLTYDGASFKLYLSTDGVTFNMETISGSSGSDADLLSCFNNVDTVDTILGSMWQGYYKYINGLKGSMYSLKIWKGTLDTSQPKTVDYVFNTIGINQPVTDIATGYNGQCWNGVVQDHDFAVF